MHTGPSKQHWIKAGQTSSTLVKLYPVLIAGYTWAWTDGAWKVVARTGTSVPESSVLEKDGRFSGGGRPPSGV